MRSRCAITVTCLVSGLLTMNGPVFAHGTEKHGNTSPTDARMKKLHDMMPVFSVAAAKLETALEKGELAAVETEAKKIIAAIPDLKKSKPHKNIKQRKKYVNLATKLEETISSTVDLAKKGDFAGAKTIFKKAEEACASCHDMFRE